MLSRTRAKGCPKDARRKQRAMARAGKAGAVHLDNIESASPIVPTVE